jgi:hypothetical protein
MNDLIRDWRSWTRAERTFATLLSALIVVGTNVELWHALTTGS